MERLRVRMKRNDTSQIPQFQLPEGFAFKRFIDGDQEKWAEIELAAGEFDTKEQALERFEREFGHDLPGMQERSVFILNQVGEAIATTTAWYGDLMDDGVYTGRIHFVAVKPGYQGRKLSKPLLSEAMNILATYHDKIYLTSQTTSYKAISMYLNYGFEPHFFSDTCQEAWELMEQVLQRPILKEQNK